MIAHWRTIARPEQLPPDDDWKVFLLYCGRGFGKTRAAAEWLAEQAATHLGTRWAIVAPTYTECRVLCIDGCSGVVQALKRTDTWESTDTMHLIVRLRNGSEIRGYSADRMDRLTGEYDGAWAEEMGVWDRPTTAWDALEAAVPRGNIFATASPYPGVAEQLAVRTDITVHTVRGSTFANESNLSPRVVAELVGRYGPDHPQVAGPLARPFPPPEPMGEPS